VRSFAVDIGKENPAIVVEPVEDPVVRPAEQPVPSEPVTTPTKEPVPA
jgi:hypothetical protein